MNYNTIYNCNGKLKTMHKDNVHQSKQGLQNGLELS